MLCCNILIFNGTDEVCLHFLQSEFVYRTDSIIGVISRLKDCGAVSPRFDAQLKDLELEQKCMLSLTQFEYLVLGNLSWC